jgi:hypothetical protein
VNYAKHIFMSFPFSFILLMLISSQIQEPFFIYLWVPHTFFYDFTNYLDCKLVLWNVNLVCNTYLSFLFFFSKNNKNIFCFQFKLYWFLISARVRNTIYLFFDYVIFTNVKVGNICSRIFSGARVINIISRPSKK